MFAARPCLRQGGRARSRFLQSERARVEARPSAGTARTSNWRTRAASIWNSPSCIAALMPWLQGAPPSSGSRSLVRDRPAVEPERGRDREAPDRERGPDAPNVADHAEHRAAAGLTDRVRLPRDREHGRTDARLGDLLVQPDRVQRSRRGPGRRRLRGSAAIANQVAPVSAKASIVTISIAVSTKSALVTNRRP